MPDTSVLPANAPNAQCCGRWRRVPGGRPRAPARRRRYQTRVL